ncbi:substrate-binding periplasmic protein [Roseibium sp.]|uniref:substrate-binding periplasmic protein n=1 Tax=Roseibium sp. TaxID=1936156 RepID=UPI00391BCDA4
MKRLAHITLIPMGLAFGATAVKAETVRLVTLEYPPYQYEAGPDADGIVVRILRDAFAKMNADISIEVLPWKRSLKMVETGDADAIFTAYKTAERETFLDYSKTVLMPQVVSVWVNKDKSVAFDGSMDSLSDVSIGLVDGLSYGGTVDDAIKSGVLTSLDYARKAPTTSRNSWVGGSMPSS